MRLAVDTGEEDVNTGCVNTCLTAGVNSYTDTCPKGVLTHPATAAQTSEMPAAQAYVRGDRRAG
eukprot:3418134-Prymnesium_polylepis.1